MKTVEEVYFTSRPAYPFRLILIIKRLFRH